MALLGFILYNDLQIKISYFLIQINKCTELISPYKNNDLDFIYTKEIHHIECWLIKVFQLFIPMTLYYKEK